VPRRSPAVARSGACRPGLLFLCALALAVDAAAQTSGGHAGHDDAPQHDHAGATGVVCAICPPARESSGTAWQPDVADRPHGAARLGAWSLRYHVQASLAGVDEGGPRGGRQLFSTNHGMLAMHRSLGSGVLGVQSMWSLEPLMGARGYPLLLQTGETADGVTPLIDRQHPHDLAMELAVTYGRALADGRAWFLYLAPVGAPAFGPPAFMHRPSAADLPVSPITHHWFDSMHITAGVVTLGFVPAPAAKVEISGFGGRESDERRWNIAAPRIDSVSARLSVNPRPSLALQVSVAGVSDPEPLHPGADVSRLSASAMYSRRWQSGSFDGTLAWARSRRAASQIPVPGGALLFPGAVTPALLGEAAVKLGMRHTVMTRIERVRKDELFALADPRHSVVYPMSRATVGYGFSLPARAGVTVTLGAAASRSRVGDGLEVEYGGSPASYLAFLSLRTH
jgi:hypothetical protein